MDASITVAEFGTSAGRRRSLRSSLGLVLVILAACGWDAGLSLYLEAALAEMKGLPSASDWPSRFVQLSQRSAVLFGPGILTAWLAAGGYPTSPRMGLRTVLAFALGSAVGHIIYFPLLSSPFARPVWHIHLDSLLTTTLMAACVVGAMYWWRRETASREELHRTRLGLLALQADCADAELLRLHTQIEPHFLFNTMAIIVQMYGTDRAAAVRTLARLIDYMSAARVHMQRQEVLLGEELELTEGYLEIQCLRMGVRLRHEIVVPPELRATRIPPAALLTLVENAIKHGLSPQPGGGVLRVAAQRDGDWVTLHVSDNGVGFRATGGRGLGLTNLRARILGLYGSEASLRLTGSPEGGVMATMRLPFGPPSSAWRMA